MRKAYLASRLKSMPYEALDFYDVDSLLTDEERMVRDIVRDFVDEEVISKHRTCMQRWSLPRRMESCPWGNGSPWCSASGL